jgi:two-component system, OmpR family, phosphate regulon response regulator PhoB
MTALRADPHVTPRARKRECAAPPLVLVVEDHDDTRFLLKTMLEMRGYRVAEASNGEEGVLLAGSEHPQLVLMDATLPRMDGLAATRRIRSDSSLEGVPVVFLSGHAQPDFRAAALDAGGTDFLVKPVVLSELASVVEKHLRAA